MKSTLRSDRIENGRSGWLGYSKSHIEVWCWRWFFGDKIPIALCCHIAATGDFRKQSIRTILVQILSIAMEPKVHPEIRAKMFKVAAKWGERRARGGVLPFLR